MKNKDFAIAPFNSALIKDRFLVSNLLGAWDFLDKKEFAVLNSYKLQKATPLFQRLYNRGILIDASNLERLINDFRNLNSHLLNDASLHIAVVTTRCNLACKYCQTKTPEGEDMSHEVAVRVLKYLYDVKNPCITLEFQGGEPLLNWDVLAFLVEHARKCNTAGKDLKIDLVTNLTLLDKNKIKFLVNNNVNICASLDGPEGIHDKNRVFKRGKGTYSTVVKNIKILKDSFAKKVNLLPTITKYSLGHYKEIIDEYVKWEQPGISLRPVNKMGLACSSWIDLGYSAEEFNEFYRKSMDYILELNKKGTFISERIARVILEKIINKRDPGYVDLMNPCGMGRASIVYTPDGSCYPCDEARMLKDEMFKLGNILKENYEDLMKKDNLVYLLESSLVNLWDYNSPFLPWMGSCPIVNYAAQKNMVPKIWCSQMHKIYNFQFKYIFEKILEDGENLTIFKRWTERGSDEKSKRKEKIQ